MKLRQLEGMKWQSRAEKAEAKCAELEIEIVERSKELSEASDRSSEKDVQLRSMKRKYGVIVKDLRSAVRSEAREKEKLQAELDRSHSLIEEMKESHAENLKQATRNAVPSGGSASGHRPAPSVRRRLIMMG